MVNGSLNPINIKEIFLLSRLTEQQIRNLFDTGIELLYHDVINRIGSHTIGGNPDPNYIKQQERILAMMQDEIERRESK